MLPTLPVLFFYDLPCPSVEPRTPPSAQTSKEKAEALPIAILPK